MSKIDNQIHTADFGTILDRTLELKTDEEIRQLEEYASKLDNINKLALGWSEEYTDTINLADELANAKATFLINNRYQATLGGQEVEFKKEGKTYKPHLKGIEIKGQLKRQLVAVLTQGVEPTVVAIGTEATAKYLVQYSTYALEVYVFKNGNSFFKVYLSSQAMKRKNTIHRPNTYSYESGSKIDGDAFPMIEMDMLEKALELEEELTNLMFKSDSVARAIAARREDKLYDLQQRIQELEAQLEE